MVMTIMAEVLWLSYNAFKLLLDVTASKDTLYRNGEEIACLWEPNPDNICFDRVPGNSYARKYERDWSERKGKRQERQFDQ
jgi:hypothetical protein